MIKRNYIANNDCPKQYFHFKMIDGNDKNCLLAFFITTYPFKIDEHKSSLCFENLYICLSF